MIKKNKKIKNKKKKIIKFKKSINNFIIKECGYQKNVQNIQMG